MTVQELLDFCNENDIPLNAELVAIGATVKFIGYDRTENMISIDDTNYEEDFDIYREV